METTLKLLLLALTLTLLLCANPAAGFSCSACETKDNCHSDDTVTCFEREDRCMTITFNATIKGKSTVSYWRRCAHKVACPDSAQTLSLTNDFGTLLANVQCCDTKDCNTNALPIPTAPSGGTLTCPRCPSEVTHCPSSIKCAALDTHCMDHKKIRTLAPPSEYMFGCVSGNLCGLSGMMDRFYNVLTDKGGLAIRFCRPPPVIMCELCLDPCQSCANTSTIPAPPGMKCMSATFTDSNGHDKHLKGLAGAPLSLHEGSLSYPRENSDTKVKVKTCGTNNCNKDAPDEGAVSVSDMSAELRKQVWRLTQSVVFIPPEPPAAPPAAPAAAPAAAPPAAPPADQGHHEGEVHE